MHKTVGGVCWIIRFGGHLSSISRFCLSRFVSLERSFLSTFLRASPLWFRVDQELPRHRLHSPVLPCFAQVVVVNANWTKGNGGNSFSFRVLQLWLELFTLDAPRSSVERSMNHPVVRSWRRAVDCQHPQVLLLLPRRPGRYWRKNKDLQIIQMLEDSFLMLVLLL